MIPELCVESTLLVLVGEEHVLFSLRGHVGSYCFDLDAFDGPPVEMQLLLHVVKTAYRVHELVVPRRTMHCWQAYLVVHSRADQL